MKPMRWDSFMGYTCYSPNTCVMRTYPKSALTPFSCVQSVAYSVKNHKLWECKNLMQVSVKWPIEPHEIGVWHLHKANTILYGWDRKSKKLDSPTTPLTTTEYMIQVDTRYFQLDIANFPWTITARLGEVIFSYFAKARRWARDRDSHPTLLQCRAWGVQLPGSMGGVWGKVPSGHRCRYLSQVYPLLAGHATAVTGKDD